MPYWKPLTIDGVSIDLSHLEIFEFEMLPTGSPNKATIRVIFNNHCFSETYDTAVHAASLPATHTSAHETRGFDPERYELSKSLRGHIERFPGQRIAQTRTGTLVKVTLADAATMAFSSRSNGCMRQYASCLSSPPIPSTRTGGSRSPAKCVST